jgi:nickel/cobalt transporter (NicO) family protein
MRATIRVALFAGLALVIGVCCAGAQAGPPAAFGPSPAASPSAPSPFAASPSAPSAFGTPQAAPLYAPGFVGAFFSWVVDTQQAMQRELTGGVKRLKTENLFAAAAGLAGLSFLYGVVHALGPGHGKTIISSYVVANEETVRRGVTISFIAAALQATTAVVLIGILAIALNMSGLTIKAWSLQLESASYALIALVGLWLLTNQLRAIWRRRRDAQHTRLASAHGHDHHDHHSHDHGHDHGPAHAHSHARAHSHTHPDGEHGHHHAEGEACSHVVDPQALAGPVSWHKIMAVVFSVGIRPCSGAILVLVFALTQGLFWAGVAATFAMAFGTALTVAALATAALGSRELALKLGGRGGAWANAVWTACAIGGSTLILLFGAILFTASLGPARPF